MDFVTPIVTPVVESLLVPVKRQLGFLVSSSTMVRDVHAKVTELDGAASDLHTQQVSSTANRRVVPHRVPGWLEDVRTIKSEIAEKIPAASSVGCCNLKMRYKAGRDSADILKRIDCLMKEKAEIVWPNEIIPLGAVSPPRPSTSPPVHLDTNKNKNKIESRNLIFKEALKSLEPNNNMTQMIALCGMAGVGKTTMMEELLKAAKDRKMFDYIVKVVVGQNPNLLLAQQTIAEQTGESLKETTKDTRAMHLKERFKARSEEGKKKILIILDDVWDVLNLEDIGLTSPLPNGFKLLLTSREDTSCIGMGIEASSIFKIEVLKDPEDKNLFWEITGVGSHSDIADLRHIGEDIIKRCGGLPIAIKTIASTLTCVTERHEWNHALFCIQNRDFPVIINIFEFSYNNLKEDDLKATFLLCGLFPEDSNINIEELVMYGWGLKFFKNVHSIAIARSRVKTYVNKLIRSNLLIKSDHEGCVMMHDLVRDYVLSSFSKVKQASIVNQNNNVSWHLKEESYERILLRCEGIVEIPDIFDRQNLTLLKLMGQHKLLKFPTDFYTRMENLEVVAYNDMRLPLLPHYTTNLRALCLHSCSLVDNDVSFVGDLIYLEILILADCGIHKLPSKIGKLKRLKLLDLSGCVNLYIDDGVFQNLNQLEELYMRIRGGSSMRFSDTNCDELKVLSRHLIALELEFYKNKIKPNNVSFENLERFRISMGCPLEKRIFTTDHYSFKNRLMLKSSTCEIQECKINELFSKTEKLHLEVKDMSHLEDILMHPSQNAFCNISELSISKCDGLEHLFTTSMANSLTKLERLIIKSCSVLKTVVNGENSEARVVKFHRLKVVSLDNLPELVSLCGGHVDVTELPQLMELELDGLPNNTSIFLGEIIDISSMRSFFNKVVKIPKLKKLKITDMEKLKEIWNCETTTTGEVEDSNVFPNNPMRLLSHLEEVSVRKCGSVEVLFNIDLGKTEQLSSLRSIKVEDCGSFRAVCMIKDFEDNHLIRAFQAVKDINIWGCEKFRNIAVTPATAHFDTGAVERNEELVNNNNSREEEIRISKADDDNLSTRDVAALFTSSYQMASDFHQLRHISVGTSKEVEVVFEIQSQTSGSNLLLLPYLEILYIWNMEKLSHVWKCNYSWNHFFILHSHPSFLNLTTIELWDCPSIKYLFSPLMVKLLSNLKEIRIIRCDGMEEVVSNRDDGEEITSSSYPPHTTPTNFFPRLHLLQLAYMKSLKHIGGVVAAMGATDVGNDRSTTAGQFVDVVSWSLCQYSKEISINGCDALSSVIPYDVAGQTQKLQHLKIEDCTSMREVFETKETKNKDTSCCDTTVAFPRPTYNTTVHKLPHLKILSIVGCDRLEYIFTFCTLESLKRLEELRISKCGAMKVIVREEVGEDKITTSYSKNVVFASLKSITLNGLPNLTGFFLGMNVDFEWPLLEHVMIEDCPQLRVFTSGRSTTPRLEYIHTKLGKHDLQCGLSIHQTPPTSSDDISSNTTILEGRTWSFHNLIQCEMDSSHEDTKIFPSNDLQKLEKLETIHASWCKNVEEVFEVTSNESQTIVTVPKLREVNLEGMYSLKYIWKSNRCRRILELPNLTRLSIYNCGSLEYVFTCSMVGCVKQLQELHIEWCDKMKVIVKEEEGDCDAKVSEIFIEFPSLKSLTLTNLPSLEGFYLEKTKDFAFPSLDTLEISDCPEIKVFTEGRSILPEQTMVETGFGCFNVGEDNINSFIMTKKQEGFNFLLSRGLFWNFK